MDKVFDQSPYRCRLDWGVGGAIAASERGDVLVVVDTLSFSTAVATAVAHGGLIVPCLESDDPIALANKGGGEAAVGRIDVPAKGRFSLSPLTYLGMEAGTKVWLGSPNGATCARCAGAARAVFVGALVNAGATSAAIGELLRDCDACATVIAAGEQSPGGLRFAIEDYLGAGAILSALRFEKSPEAEVCAAAFLASRDRIADLIWDCASGRELRSRGFSDDVRRAMQVDLYNSCAVLRDGALHGSRQ